MTAHEHVTDVEVADLVRNRLQAYALKVPVPELWSDVSEQISTAKPGNGVRLRTPRWLASAGTVLFITVSVVVWVMLINDQDGDVPIADEPEGLEALQRSDGEDVGTPVDVAVFDEIFASLESAGPFKVEGELFTTSRPRGVVSTLPAAGGTPILDQEEFRFRFVNNGFIELECVEGDPDRVCLLGLSEQPVTSFKLAPECTSTTERPAGICGNALSTGGPYFISSIPVATMRKVGGSYRYQSVYLRPDVYRIERTLTIDPAFKAEVEAKMPVVELFDDERTVTLRQQETRYFDSSSPAPGGYGYINTGTVESFLAAHLNPFLTQPPQASLDETVNFEDVRLISSSNSNVGFHYHATISGTIGEFGTWDMWVGEDGLPRKIDIEVFTSPQWRGIEEGDVETTRVSLTFFDFGGPVDSDEPLRRFLQ